jgi:hypothetical protein
MAWEKCDSCKKEFFKKTGDESCPNCSELIEPRTSVKSPTELKENLIEQAGNQARVVDKFGKVLQAIGYIFISILTIGLIVSAWTATWIGMGVFLIAIPATFISFNVFGSALRAVALYIQVRVR